MDRGGGGTAVCGEKNNFIISIPTPNRREMINYWILLILRPKKRLAKGEKTVFVTSRKKMRMDF